MYIAAPENVWYFIEAVLAMIFLLLAQKWFYNGQIYRNREADRKTILKFIINTTKGLNDILSKTTNKKEEDFDDEDDDEDLDDIVDDFLK